MIFLYFQIKWVFKQLSVLNRMVACPRGSVIFRRGSRGFVPSWVKFFYVGPRKTRGSKFFHFSIRTFLTISYLRNIKLRHWHLTKHIDYAESCEVFKFFIRTFSYSYSLQREEMWSKHFFFFDTRVHSFISQSDPRRHEPTSKYYRTKKPTRAHDPCDLAHSNVIEIWRLLYLYKEKCRFFWNLHYLVRKL